ncbi:MAG: flagellar biosynthetic protein FliR [Bacteriovorax sp.]|jgi:flagellar biosynthetic protein FliR|nr:flagellar biosynthetic protein FliR [Bacteriovorax sp.]
MLSLQITDMTVIVAFWLAFTRWLAVIFQLPLFDNVSIPVVVKVLATLVITFAFFPLIEGQLILDIKHVGVESFWYLTIFNTIVGLVIGFFVKSIMSIFISAGALITQQVGFNALHYFDPNAGGQVGPFEKLIEWTVLMMILTTGALIPMFKGVISSFSTVHIYNLGKMAHSAEFFIMMFKAFFISALMLSTPMIFINVVINAVMGIVSRAVPQMNVIAVSFAVNIGLGLLVFVAGSDEFFQTCFRIYTEKLGQWFQFLS